MPIDSLVIFFKLFPCLAKIIFLMICLMLQMDGESNEQQTKQERLRTRWTPALDKIFADIVVEQIRQGNRPNNVFDKKTWNQIREEFNRQTGLSFNNNQLRKHLDVLRTRYHNLQSTFAQNDAMPDPCFMGFDLWEDIGVSIAISCHSSLYKYKMMFPYKSCLINSGTSEDGTCKGEGMSYL